MTFSTTYTHTIESNRIEAVLALVVVGGSVVCFRQISLYYLVWGFGIDSAKPQQLLAR